MLSLFKNEKKYYRKKTFTYYVPAPPVRRNGYQEKEFDKVMTHIQDLGFDILDIQTQSHSHPDQAGLWIVCLLGAPTKAIYEKILDFDYSDIADLQSTHIPMDPDIVHDA